MYSNDPVYHDYKTVQPVRLWPYVLAGISLILVYGVGFLVGEDHEQASNHYCSVETWGAKRNTELVLVCPSTVHVSRMVTDPETLVRLGPDSPLYGPLK